MDEVEIIQNYILEQAGEDTDVILGLGYDSTLGAQIGITLIATGFEHKDPFPRKSTVSEAAKPSSEKVVMELEMPKQAAPLVAATQPTLQFEDTRVENSTAEIAATQDPMMPTMTQENNVEIPSKTTVDNLNESPVFFEISSSSDQVPVIQFDTEFIAPLPKQAVNDKSNPPKEEIKQEASNKSQLSSGGFLVKPTQIYADAKPEKQTSISNEQPLPTQFTMQDDEPVMEMKLVVKENLETAEDKPLAQFQTQPFISNTVEEPALQDETEELRRRASERIAKLRNLSFNINASDPNNEFETVPAYLRRNMEIHNQIADVETFYSNYTVSSDDKNQAEINTINNFLDGKKPD
jgi:cell division protein FtsZ